MKPSRSLFGCLALLAATTLAFAAAPATNASHGVPAPVNNAADDQALDALPEPAVPTPPELKFGDYIKDLTAALKLTDAEKKKIEAYYVADAVQVKSILDNDALSPLQQARQVSDLRDMRNVKIEALLDDLDRQQEFLKIEARYRVALTELAANGGLVAAAPPPAAASPAPAANAPAAAK